MSVSENAGPSAPPVSPLSESEPVVVERKIAATEIIAKYARYLGIDIRDDLHGCETVLLCRGRQSQIRFFWPQTVAGGSRFYERLMARESYYLSDKWEYGAACGAIPARQRVLEIGCGTGEFLARLRTLGHDGVGLEINDKAVRQGVAAGLDIRLGRIEEFAESNEDVFDVVCAFQVLEHVVDPRSFIEASLRCLRTGGLAIFAVPNGEGPLSALDVALDMPPHHMLRWNTAAFQYLTHCFPIVLEDIQYEPLSQLHVGMLATACFNHLSLPQRGWNAFRRKVMATLAARYWKRYFSELHVKGHTLLAVFRKQSLK